MSRHPDPATEQLLRQRLHQLADHAPVAVRSLDEVAMPVLPDVVTAGPTRRRRRAAGIGATIAVLAAGAGLTTLAFQEGGDAGASTPEQAVLELAAAVNDEDVLGMLDALLPVEALPLRLAVERSASEAQRVGLLDESLDLSGLGGLDLSVTDLQLEVEALDDDLAVVRVTGGSLGATFDPAAFALGPWIEDAFGDDLRAGDVRAEVSDSADGVLVAVVRHDGRWYVSPSFTAAEYARRAAGRELPAAPVVEPVGSTGPEAAATAFYERLAAFDLAGTLALVAPGEGAALHRYAPLWLSEADEAIAGARADGWDLRLSGVAFDDTGQGGARRQMVPTAFVLEGTVAANAGPGMVMDPTVPTVVEWPYEAKYAVVPAGQPVPATVESLELSDRWPEIVGGAYNFTWADEEGRITPLTMPGSEPQPVRVELADGCTSFEGTMFTEVLFGLDRYDDMGYERLDRGYRLCGRDELAPIAAVSLISLGGLGGFSLPPLEVVEVGGSWFVSPVGTLVSWVPNALASVPDGANLIDTWMAPYVLNGMNRAMLERNLVEQPLSMLAAECLAVVVVGGDRVVGLVDDPPLRDVRRCADHLWYGSWGPVPGIEAPHVETTLAPLPEDHDG